MIKRTQRKRHYSTIFLCVSLLLCTACSTEKTSDLTTQSRKYESEENNDEEFTSERKKGDSITEVFPETSTGEAYLEQLAEKLGVDREDFIDNYGFWELILATGDTLPQGLARVFPNVDFQKSPLKFQNEDEAEQVEGHFVLTSQLRASMNKTEFMVTRIDEDNMKLKFQIEFHSFRRCESIDELDSTFQSSETVQSEIEFFEDNPYDDLRGFYVLDVSFTNMSDQEYRFFVNCPLYRNYGELGAYSILLSNIEVIDFISKGGERGDDKASRQVLLRPGESCDIKLLYGDTARIPSDDIYINLTPLLRFGDSDGKGTYYPNTDPNLSLYKLEVNP